MKHNKQDSDELRKTPSKCLSIIPDWDSIQNSVQKKMSKDVAKRKTMEARLREMENRNLKILGINDNDYEKITGKKFRREFTSSETSSRRQTFSTEKSLKNHKDRMGRALSNKLRAAKSSSAKGGALSRSKRILR